MASSVELNVARFIDGALARQEELLAADLTTIERDLAAATERHLAALRTASEMSIEHRRLSSRRDELAAALREYTKSRADLKRKEPEPDDVTDESPEPVAPLATKAAELVLKICDAHPELPLCNGRIRPKFAEHVTRRLALQGIEVTTEELALARLVSSVLARYRYRNDEASFVRELGVVRKAAVEELHVGRPGFAFEAALANSMLPFGCKRLFPAAKRAWFTATEPAAKPVASN